jgi:hypothetical protein
LAAGAANKSFKAGTKRAQPKPEYRKSVPPELLEATPQAQVAAVDELLERFIGDMDPLLRLLQRSQVYHVSDNLAPRAQEMIDLARGHAVQMKRYINGLTGNGTSRPRPYQPRRYEAELDEPQTQPLEVAAADVVELEPLPADGFSRIEALLQRLIELNEAQLEVARSSASVEG